MNGGAINWDSVIGFLMNFSPWILVQILFLAGFAAYLIFATVVAIQVFAMTKTVSSPLNFLVRLFGILHFVFALGVMLFMLGAL